MKVLFVCSGNAYRSPLAEALLKKLRPDFKADSAGTEPETRISGQAREYLAKENAEQYLKKAPEGLDVKQLGDYDLIIAMEQRHKDAVQSRCSECRGRIVVWNIEDVGFRPLGYVEEINKQIKEKVAELAKSL